MKFRNRKNFLFVLFACAILITPCSTILLQKLAPGFSTSNFLNQQDIRLLEGGVSNELSIKEHLSYESIVDRTLQKSVEGKFNNAIPGKYYLLLGNASLQRSWIELSNYIFQYDLYQTKYGSESLFIPSAEALQAFPIKITKDNSETIDWLSNNLADLAYDYPEKHFCIIVTDNSETSEALPVTHLSNNLLTTNKLAEQINNGLKELPNISVLSDAYHEPTSYYHHYYTSDHHWNGWGAISAYNRCIDQLINEQGIGVSFLKFSNMPQALEGLNSFRFNGSYSRNGLMLLNESLDEPAIPLNEVAVEYDSAYPYPFIALPNGVEEIKTQNGADFEFYGYWYGKYSPKMITRQKTRRVSNNNALIIGDSYSSAFRWIAATKFDQTISYQDMHTSARDVQGIREKIDSSDADYIFIVAGAPNYLRLEKALPKYFD